MKTLIALPIFFFFLFLSLSAVKAQECVEPYENLEITNDTTLCGGTYYLNDTDTNGVIQVTGSNLTLDCNNTVLIGNDTYHSIGFYILNNSNVTLKNCEARRYNFGFNSYLSANITFLNTTVKDFKRVWYDDTGDSGFLIDNSNDVTIDGFSITDGNITRCPDKEDCNFRLNVGIWADRSTYVTIRNGVMDGINDGIEGDWSSHMTLENVIFTNIVTRIGLGGGSFINVTNNTFKNMGMPPHITLGLGQYNNFYIGHNNFINTSGWTPVWIPCNSSNAIIEYNKIESPYGMIGLMIQTQNAIIRYNNITITATDWVDGLAIVSNYNNTVYGNNISTIKDNPDCQTDCSGIAVQTKDGSGSGCVEGNIPNTVYNNILNAHFPAYFDSSWYGHPSSDYWNISYQSGINIWNASLGYIGGNLYTTPSNDGFSDTCNDVNSDGFCDSPYTLAENNTDYLPIAKVLGYYLAVTFNYNSVAFGQLLANSTNPAPNQLNGIYNVTVDTNANYNVKASGLDFTPALAISNLKFDTNSTAENLNSDQAVALSNTVQTIDTYPSATTVNYHGYWISIPAGQYATTYNTTVTINYGKA